MDEPKDAEARQRAEGGGSGARRPGVLSGWSLRLATVLGIPIRIHFTFVLLLLWFGWESSRRGGSALLAMLFLLLLFVCVVLHELGHAAMAQRFGVRTREIVLYPIGGIARLDRMPSGTAELLIALAGPAVNLVLGALLGLGMWLFDLPALVSMDKLRTMEAIIAALFWANVVIFLFNLLPAFPMDGGRVLRASLTFFMPEDRATHYAALVGQGMAILFGTAGLIGGNPILIFIAFFVFLGAGQEAAFHRTRAIVRGRTAREAMVTRFETLAPQDSLDRATELLLATHQQDFPVIDAWGRVAGVLPRPTLLEGLAKLGRDAAVLEIMQREVPTVSPDAELDKVMGKMQRDPATPLLVLEGSRLVGMITVENLGELIEVFKRIKQ